MRILNRELIGKFAKKHANARQPLNNWVDVVSSLSWANHAELKATFSTADLVSDQGCVFNVGGNNYRLLAAVSFSIGIVAVKWVKTHAEYDNWKP